jgi:limonene-1,2-epoxide hydrolase
MIIKVDSKWGTKNVTIDDEDYELVSQFEWKIEKSKKKGFQVYTEITDMEGKTKKMYMAELIMGIYEKVDSGEITLN